MTLLELAQKFDALDPVDILARIEPAVQIEQMLGDRADEFDERFVKLLYANPAHQAPAETVLREMGLAS